MEANRIVEGERFVDSGRLSAVDDECAGSRSRRFTRFRRTIFCLCLGTTSPQRERETGEAETNTSR